MREQEKLLTEHEARKILPFSLAWFRKQRQAGGGPRFVRISNRVFYPESGLLEFITCQPMGGEVLSQVGTGRPSSKEVHG
jgi:hypothetical protein